MRCVSCGYEGKMQAKTERHEVKVGDQGVKGLVPASACPTCNEVYIEGKDLDRLELEVADAVIRAGIVDGATFRFLRHALGMQAKELAPLLGTTPETIS